MLLTGGPYHGLHLDSTVAGQMAAAARPVELCYRAAPGGVWSHYRRDCPPVVGGATLQRVPWPTVGYRYVDRCETLHQVHPAEPLGDGETELVYQPDRVGVRKGR